MVVGSYRSTSGTPWGYFYIDGQLVQYAVVATTGWGEPFGGFVIPNGSSYKVSGAPVANIGIYSWYELR